MSTESSINIVALVAEESVKYLPRLNQQTGSKEATILLLRVLHWWEWTKRRGNSKFYKFSAPCEHPWYQEGDSWQEELGFSRHEIETALARIGTRVRKGKETPDALKSQELNACVLFYTNAQRVTYYRVNEAAVCRLFANCYPGNSHYANAENPHYANAENPHYANAENPHYLILTDTNHSITEEQVPARTSAPDNMPVSDTSKPKRERSRKKAPTRTPTGKIRDNRCHHPAVRLLRGISGNYPQKVYWDDIIKLADPDQEGSSNLDACRVKEILQLFQSVGGLTSNYLTWFFEWYLHGVPARYMNRELDHPIAMKYRRTNGVNQGGSTEAGPRLRKPLNEQ